MKKQHLFKLYLASSLILLILNNPLQADDLKTDEFTSINEAHPGPSTSPQTADPDAFAKKQWYERIDIGGYLAAGYLRTGTSRTDASNGHFEVYAAQVNIDASIWDHVSAYVSLYPIGWPTLYSSSFATVGEANIHLKNLINNSSGDTLLGIKIGRFDTPYGADYLSQEYTVNPLISRSASWWWSWDEGILLYSNLLHGKLGLIFAIQDGSKGMATDDDISKQLALKIYGEPLPNFHLALSLMDSGRSASNELWQGWRHIAPNYVSTAKNASMTARGYFAEVDANWTAGQIGTLSCEAGIVTQQNIIASPGRDPAIASVDHIQYASIEPLVNITDQLYGVARYSFIRTGNNNVTLPFNDGYSTTNVTAAGLSRVALGAGYKLNMNTTFKLEYGWDYFDGGTVVANIPNKRAFYGLQAVAKF